MMEDRIIDQYQTINEIPAMTSPRVHNYLRELGKGWRGKGIAMELGCWLGASSIALLEGLVQVGYDKEFWAFDKWQAYGSQLQKAKDQGMILKDKQDTRPIYTENVKRIYNKIRTVKGGLPTSLQVYNQQAIEICIFDAPKQEPIFTGAVHTLINFWIPGVTVWGLLDYGFYERHTGRKRDLFMAPVRFMEKYADHFSIIKQWDDEAVKFFKYEKKINF